MDDDDGIIRLVGRQKNDWGKYLFRGPRGGTFNTLANVMIALSRDPAFNGAFEFNEMQQDTILLRNMPTVRDGPAPDCPRPIADDDVLRLQEWLQYQGMPQIGEDVVGRAMHMRAKEFRRHPLRDWLTGLDGKWDNTRRLSNWLPHYLGAKADSPKYLPAIGRMFLVAMVARIMKPGCKADYMPVLEGPQGLEKSKACATLAGQEYFSDSLPDLHTKDARQHLRGKWLVEIAELSALAKADVETYKTFITRTHELYRPPYGKHDVNEPRQCLFIGTTNKLVYIKDETGWRRGWPITCGRIEIAKLEDDREQLFAEAVHYYRGSDATLRQWWPGEAFEREHIKPQQDKRIETDAWDAAILNHIDESEEDRFGVCQLARAALGFESDARIGTADQRRVSSILQTLGLTAGRSHGARYYEKGDEYHAKLEERTAETKRELDTATHGRTNRVR